MPDVGGQISAAMGQLIATRLELMIDECRVTRPDALPQTPELDADGNVTPDDAAPVYEGPCTIANPRSALQGNRTATDDAGVRNHRILRVAQGAALRPGDLVTVTATAVSPGLLGSVFVVAGEEERTYATYRRYQLRGSSWESATTGG